MFELFSASFTDSYSFIVFQLLQGKLQAKEVYKVSCHRKFSDSSRLNKYVTAIHAFFFDCTSVCVLV